MPAPALAFGDQKKTRPSFPIITGAMAEDTTIMKQLNHVLVSALIMFSLVIGCPCTQSQGTYNLNFGAIRNAVVFLYLRDDSGSLLAAGTGFLMGAPLKGDPHRIYVFLVTARHIADPAWDGCRAVNGTWRAVFNKADYDPQRDSTGTVELAFTNQGPNRLVWHYPKDESVDIAVAMINWDDVESNHVANVPMGVANLPTKEDLAKMDSGSAVASAGLLLGASGSQRNYPIFKFGYISSIPSEKIPSKCCPDCTVQMQTEWMVAASLVGGNSGSPIFCAPSLVSLPNQLTRAVLLGVQSTSFEGTDVAGMAPVSYLIDILRDWNLPDVDLSPAIPSSPDTVAAPTAGHPESNARPASLSPPH
jgi:hypothetical protein